MTRLCILAALAICLTASPIGAAEPTPPGETITEFRPLLPAITRPGRRVVLSAPVAEAVRTINAREGDTVTAGSPLIQFVDDTARAEFRTATIRAEATGTIEEARERMEFARTNESMMRQAHESAAAGDIEFIRAQSERRQAEAAFTTATDDATLARAEAEAAKVRLHRHTLLAPFDGIVTRVDLEQGATPLVGDPVMELVDLSTLKVDVFLAASDAHQLIVGRSYTMTPDRPVARTPLATLHAIIPTIDPATGTVRCIFKINNETSELPAGFEISSLAIAEQEDIGELAHNEVSTKAP